MVTPLISMLGITKRFPGVIANNKINLELYPGEIHALLGENGSGKSTLMSILTGLYQPTEGKILVEGKETQFSSPADAIKNGIGMVHQHFKLIESFTVAENIALSDTNGSFKLDMAQLEADIAELSSYYGLKIDPHAHVWQLGVGEKQRVEILRMLYHKSKVLILDEPTAVLTPQETRELFINLRKMADNGCAVVFISHKLNEVEELADRITVLRSGVVSGHMTKEEINRASLIKMMVGRELNTNYDHKESHSGDVVLKLEKISALGDMHTLALDNVSFEIRAGEIYGIAGVSGNGQRELAEVIAGMRLAMGGKMYFCGDDFTNKTPREKIEAGISYVPEDRLGTGLAPNLSSVDNIILKEYNGRFAEGWRIKWEAAVSAAKHTVEEFDIKQGSIYQPVKMMSGGNIQKLLLGREIAAKPKLMVVLYPVRGLDIGAIEAVHKLLLKLKEQNTAILLVSEELEEIAALADRVGVMFAGKLMGEFAVQDMDIEKIGALMAGVTEDGGEGK